MRCQKFNEGIPKLFVQAVLLLTCIHGTPGVNLGQDTDYPFQNLGCHGSDFEDKSLHGSVDGYHCFT